MGKRYIVEHLSRVACDGSVALGLPPSHNLVATAASVVACLLTLDWIYSKVTFR